MKSYSSSLNSNDIARLAGVSQATVSRVLSGSTKVREKTRTQVMEVVNRLGYRPNPFAQAMRTGQSGTVGVAVSRITNPIVPEILGVLAHKFAEKGRRMVVWNTDIEGESGVVAAVQQGTVDGVVFTAASHQVEAMRNVLDRNFPVVSFNRYLEDADCDQIVSTNFEGAHTIARYLVEAGRKRIAFINGPQDRTTLADRELGFRQGLHDNGMELPDAFYAQANFTHNQFRDIAMEMMRGANPPDAIACGNDVIACAVMNGLKAADVSVPGDIWVTGFDGIEMTGWDVFDLTTMRQPLEHMATDAAESLIKRIDGHYNKPKLIQYRTELTLRGSTAHTLLRQT